MPMPDNIIPPRIVRQHPGNVMLSALRSVATRESRAAFCQPGRLCASGILRYAFHNRNNPNEPEREGVGMLVRRNLSLLAIVGVLTADRPVS
jgi:hypothetical protein